MYNNNDNSLHNEIIESMWAAAFEWLAAFEANKQKQEEKNND